MRFLNARGKTARRAGCAGGNTHQVIAMGQNCSSCHPDEKTTYKAILPKNITEADGEVTVRISADKLVVCEVKFTSEDSSRYVPVNHGTVNVENGEAVITPSEGIWAICIDEGDFSKSELVHLEGGAGSTADPPIIDS